MLGPRSRSEIDFLEKNLRKTPKHLEPPLLSQTRDITNQKHQKMPLCGHDDRV